LRDQNLREERGKGAVYVERRSFGALKERRAAGKGSDRTSRAVDFLKPRLFKRKASFLQGAQMSGTAVWDHERR